MYEEYLNEFMLQFQKMPEVFIAGGAAVLFLLLYALRGIRFFRFLFSWYQRLIVIAGLCALGLWMFWIGREHQIFLDNKPMGEWRALEQVNVRINGGEVSELMARERDVKKAVGPEFELAAEVFDEDGEVADHLTVRVRPGCSKDIMISLPALAGGARNFVVPAPR